MLAKINRAVPVFAALVLTLLLGGCNANEIRNEQNQSRHVLQDLYEQELIENLVRLDHYRPFVHMQYTTVLGAAGNTRKVTANAGREKTDNDLVDVSTSGIFHALKVTLGIGGEGSQNSSLSFTAAPGQGVVLYNAYVSFLNELESEGARRFVLFACITPTDHATDYRTYPLQECDCEPAQASESGRREAVQGQVLCDHLL
jgi:hypothetical protein